MSIGSCFAAGYDTCCVGDTCLGDPQDCYCDVDCFIFDDCCADVDEVCTFSKFVDQKFVPVVF